MSWALAFWHIVPGWMVGGVGVSAAGLVALAIFAPALFGNVLSSAWKIVTTLPWQAWVAIGVVVALGAGYVGVKTWLQHHDEALAQAAKTHEAAAVEAAKKERNDFWQAREDASNAAYVEALAKLKQQLAAAKADAARRSQELNQDLANARVTIAAAADELARERAKHVTAVANARCDLTRGVIVHFNAGAAVANGERAAPDDPAHADAGGIEDESSGVSLDTYTAAVERTQVILGQARKLIDGWKALRASDERAVADANKALANCIPKGAQ